MYQDDNDNNKIEIRPNTEGMENLERDFNSDSEPVSHTPKNVQKAMPANLVLIFSAIMLVICIIVTAVACTKYSKKKNYPYPFDTNGSLSYSITTQQHDYIIDENGTSYVQGAPVVLKCEFEEAKK